MKRYGLAAIALAMSLAAFPALATQVLFNLTSVGFFGKPGEFAGHWTLDLMPTPSEEDLGLLFVIDGPISGEFDFEGVAHPINNLSFNVPAAGGGFAVNFGPDLGFDDFFAGAALFTGPASAPTFKLGTFALDNSTLTISTIGAPEPASWALMILGFGAVGAALRRRGTALRLA
jgi:PEP-CTERM motif-containing protein